MTVRVQQRNFSIHIITSSSSECRTFKYSTRRSESGSSRGPEFKRRCLTAGVSFPNVLLMFGYDTPAVKHRHSNEQYNHNELQRMLIYLPTRNQSHAQQAPLMQKNHRKARAIATQAVLRKGVDQEKGAQNLTTLILLKAQRTAQTIVSQTHFERKTVRTSANATALIHFTMHRQTPTHFHGGI